MSSIATKWSTNDLDDDYQGMADACKEVIGPQWRLRAAGQVQGGSNRERQEWLYFKPSNSKRRCFSTGTEHNADPVLDDLLFWRHAIYHKVRRELADPDEDNVVWASANPTGST